MLADLFKRAFLFLWSIFLCIPNISSAVSVKTYSYDAYGKIETITDPRGFVTRYNYDLLNRLEGIITVGGKKVKYTYDISGIRTKVTDSRGDTIFEPDIFGRINKVTFPNGESVSYSYDPDGNLIKMVYPDKTEIEYTYDPSNRLETIKDPSGETKLEYDELSNTLKKKTLPNGITTEFQYYPTRKISNVIHKTTTGALIEELLKEARLINTAMSVAKSFICCFLSFLRQLSS